MAKRKQKREARPPSSLPATFEEASALSFARDDILSLHQKGGEVGSPFEEAESRAFMAKVYRAHLMTAEGRMLIIAAARVGDEFSRDVLRSLIREEKSGGRYEQMPLEVRAYDMELGDDRPPGVPAPDPRNEFIRNVCIASTVAAVVDRFGLKPTGSSARRRSACSIVAEALEVVHMQRSAKTVESIWKRYRGGVPTVRGWSFS
jgi:hypothetical protein